MTSRPDLEDVWNTHLLPYLDEEPELVLQTRKQRVLFELMNKYALHEWCRNRLCGRIFQRGDRVLWLEYDKRNEWSSWPHCSHECRLKSMHCFVVLNGLDTQQFAMGQTVSGYDLNVEAWRKKMVYPILWHLSEVSQWLRQKCRLRTGIRLSC